jgi:hypothetical protein
VEISHLFPRHYSDGLHCCKNKPDCAALFDYTLTVHQANGDVYVVDSPGIRFHLVSDPKLIDEIDRAPHDTLSLQAAAKIVSHHSLYA